MKTTILLLLCLLCASCGPKPQVVTRAAYAQDKLTYLAENADFVGVVLVTDTTNTYVQVGPNLRLVDLKANEGVITATVTEVIKGSARQSDSIIITASPLWYPPGPGRITTFCPIKNEPHLVFLKRVDERYAPLTDSSMVPIRNGCEGGIWNRTEIPEMVIQWNYVTNTIARLKELTLNQAPNK